MSDDPVIIKSERGPYYLARPKPIVSPAALRYIANEFACMADDPAHRERLKVIVRAALEHAADELEITDLLLHQVVKERRA